MRQTQENLSKIESSMASIKKQAEEIKKSIKDWQKDYVAALVDVKNKAEAAGEDVKSFYDELNAKLIPGINQEINHLKNTLERIIHPPYLPRTNEVNLTQS